MISININNHKLPIINNILFLNINIVGSSLTLNLLITLNNNKYQMQLMEPLILSNFQIYF